MHTNKCDICGATKPADQIHEIGFLHLTGDGCIDTLDCQSRCVRQKKGQKIFAIVQAQTRETRFQFVPEQWNKQDPSGYLHLGEVDAMDLSEAFRLTNSIDNFWPENPGVRLVVDHKLCRSTSVGDVLCDVLKGEYFMVAPVGFKQVEPR